MLLYQISATGGGVFLFNFCEFLIAIMAGFVSGLMVHYFCKWLDSYKTKNKSN